MKNFYLFFTCINFLAINAFSQAIPYNQTPSWISTALSKYETGLALADINNDGYKDIVVSVGNDMSRQKLEVYYNNGNGTFPLIPDWSSSDIDYHGQLAVGDINKDGYLDVAVSVYIGPSGFSSPGKVKVYYNNNGTLENTPSFVSKPFYNFSCAFGDVNSDGYLDLAVACSDMYNDVTDSARIFINQNGSFNSSRYWKSAIKMGGMDPDFADFDRNGFADVIFACEKTPSYMFTSDTNGVLNISPRWQSSDGLLYGNSMDIGFIDNNIYPDVVITNNNQLGGDGKVRLYCFSNSNFPNTSSAKWKSPLISYASGIILNDVNNDSNLDMIVGGWWNKIYCYLGNDSSFQNSSSFNSNTNSVVETIQMADLNRDNIITTTDTIVVSQNKASFFYLKKQIIEKIVNIKRNNQSIDYINYAWVPGKNWLTLSNYAVKNDTILVTYEYSNYLDIVVTNWDTNIGNYIFYNTYSTKNDNIISKNEADIYPNPANNFVTIKASNIYIKLNNIYIYDFLGQNINNYSVSSSSEGNIILNVTDLKSGIYYIEIKKDTYCFKGKIIIIK